MIVRLLGLALLVALLVPGAAAAHSGAGTAVDYRTEPEGLLDAEGASVPGAAISVYGGDDRLELRWAGTEEVTILGYADEPYLRIGPDGAFENARSPSVESNRERFGPVVGEGSVDPLATPDWRRISHEPVAVWHDHRAHWMSQGAPPAGVSAAPDERQIVQTYEIPVLVGEEATSIPGRLEYIPPPSPWPYVAAILLAAGIGVGIALRAPLALGMWLTRGAAALGIGAGGALLIADALGAPSAGLTAGTDEAIPPFVQAGLWTVLVAVVVALWSRAMGRGAAREAVVMLIGTVALAGIAGLGRISYLDHAVIPGPISGDLARVLVVVCLAALPIPVGWAWRTLSSLRAAEHPESHVGAAEPAPDSVGRQLARSAR